MYLIWWWHYYMLLFYFHFLWTYLYGSSFLVSYSFNHEDFNSSWWSSSSSFPTAEHPYYLRLYHHHYQWVWIRVRRHHRSVFIRRCCKSWLCWRGSKAMLVPLNIFECLRVSHSGSIHRYTKSRNLMGTVGRHFMVSNLFGWKSWNKSQRRS